MSFRHLPYVAILIAAVGCSPSNTPPAGQPGNASPNTVSRAETTETPDRAVFEFLEAVRTGDDQKAADMLTPMARQKTAELQLAVAPPGSPSATFKVGKVEYVTPNKDGAHVWSSWTDVPPPTFPEAGVPHPEANQPRTDEIIWVLRREANGWRVAGMVVKVFAGQPPLVLNYEDPEDMVRKMTLLHSGADPAQVGGSEAVSPQGTGPQPTGPQAVRPDANTPAFRQ